MRPRSTTTPLPLLLVAIAVTSGCGPRSSGPPPFIAALVATFPGGGDQPTALVQVLDPDTGDPIAGATATVNGTVLPYDPSNQEFDGTFQVAPGDTIALRVTARGQTYAVDAQAATVAPTITLPAAGAVWPNACSNAITWSAAGLPGSPTALVTVLDATSPGAEPLFQELGGFPATSVEPGTLGAGPRLVVVAFVSELPVPEADPASALRVLDASMVPVTAVAADFREVAVRPANQGVARGGATSLRAEATRCDDPNATKDVTAAATWSSTRPDVATVGGRTGAVTGVAQGITTITATVAGMTGSTSLGVRDFTARASPDTGHQLLAVTWTGTQAVAVGEGGLILTSPDGVDWTRQASGSAGLLTGVAASPARLVAVQFGSTTTLTSPDGVTWTPGSLGAGSGAWSVAWAGDQFVAVGLSGGVFTSPDGLAWTQRDAGTTATLMDVVSSGSLLVAVGGEGLDVILTSTDGAGWTDRTPLHRSGTLRGVAHGGGTFVAVGDDGPMTSVDGVAWVPQPGPGYLGGVAFSGSEFMAVGLAPAIPPVGLAGVVTTSDDGQAWINWTVGEAPLGGVAWTGSRWILVGSGGAILTSP